MIWHFLEIWLLFMIVFTVGCGLGASFYSGLARGPLAVAQGAVADVVGDAVDAIKWRLGVGPDWRPAFRPPAERPTPRPGRADPARDDPRPIAVSPPSWTDASQSPREEWLGDPEWEQQADANDAENGIDDAAEMAEGQAEPVTPEDTTMMRPAGLSAPRSGVADNLQRIRGIGKRNEVRLNKLGIFHFGQIAAWTPAEARWVAAHLAFPERIERDDWIGQAIVLASGGELENMKAADRKRKAESAGEESDG